MTLSDMGKVSITSSRVFQSIFKIFSVTLVLAFFATNANAQQTGEIAGQIVDANGAGVAGVSIEANGDVLPQPRTTSSADNGRYRFRFLPPGNYEIEFTMADGSTQTRSVAVRLQQTSRLDMVTGSTMEEIVVMGTQLAADTGQGSLSSSISASTIEAIPVGQEYRDLIKLIPGVQYTEDAVRGPSAGGSGQDNAYQFDGVDVSLPLFGTLSADPSSHDIAQVTVVRGGAKAIGFNRSGGFLVNTVSKSGTDEFRAEASYQIQSASLTGDRKTGSNPLDFDEDKEWATVSLGGPVVRDRLYFYTSYYAPTAQRDNTANAYGPVGDFDDSRDEYFGKLTFSPTDNILLHGSYRTSDNEIQKRSVGSLGADSTSVGDKSTLDVAILEGSWILNDTSSVNFKYTDFQNDTSSRPDTLFSFPVSNGDSLNVGSLDQQGNFFVPVPRAVVDPSDTAFNNFIQPLIDQYGYLSNGVPTGGGNVGGASTLNDQNFSRESFEIGFDKTFFFGDTTHDVHIGYQNQTVEEELLRTSNGWGAVTVPGGRVNASDGVTPVFFNARLQQMSFLTSGGAALSPIISSSELQSFEINDTIEVGDWTYNIGVLVSNDVLYGQGLAPNAANPVTGLEASPGTKYKMYETDWSDMIQPRLGASWNYSETSTAYVNYAKYNPAASSLARAASWDRNLLGAIVDAKFDANGNFIESVLVGSSSGKVFDDNLTPRSIDEYLVGWTKDMSSELTLRAHVRYRKGGHFWEDTNNNARVDFEPPAGVPRDLYVENLADIRAEIGGSSYVIAELDGAFTKYYEASFEAEWSVDDFYLRGSYVWSHYYGNFDQDNSTTDNDQNIFIGSSNIADGVGRQVWDLKEGNLRGDRRHMLKVYGYYLLPWDASVGGYLVYQSGQPWETWDVEFYRALLTATGSGSTSNTIRYSEPAGSRTTDAHYQLDLNYTQNFAFGGDHNIQLRADIFNVFDNQTGYSIQSNVNGSNYGLPTDFFNPRRIQLAVKYQFN